MHILDLQLTTPVLSSLYIFYAQVLGLPVIQQTSESMTFQVGASRLTFMESPDPDQGSYHIGDEHGLFIVVQLGRIWFPETGKPAERLPITVIVDDDSHPATTLHFN